METLVIFIVTGAAAGLLSGLFGVGGGLILVPVLTYVLPGRGVPGASVVQTAVGTSLAIIACHSMASTHAHQAHKAVIWRVVAGLAPGLIVGGLAGAYVAYLLSGAVLKHIVAIGALLVAIQMALDLKPKTKHALPGREGMLAAGGIIGALSALVGIGGGSLTVPFLTWCSVDMRKAVGTSAACGVVIAWAGAVGFALSGLHSQTYGGPYSMGYISLPAFVTIMIVSVLTSPYGARLAHYWPQRVLKRAFSIFLFGVAAVLWLA